MQNSGSTNRRAALILALVVFGVFYMMLAMGGASFVSECQTVACGQLHQTVFAAVGAVALFVGAYRLFEGSHPRRSSFSERFRSSLSTSSW